MACSIHPSLFRWETKEEAALLLLLLEVHSAVFYRCTLSPQE